MTDTATAILVSLVIAKTMVVKGKSLARTLLVTRTIMRK